MKLVCHTRGNTSPQSKPKVYFTGHPADIDACRGDIFSDILRIQNCAIYYDEELNGSFEQEELIQALGQMQLIVIPVTSRFLYQPNRAMDVELPFAMEHHIPVLPLLQEFFREGWKFTGSYIKRRRLRKCGLVSPMFIANWAKSVAWS